MKEKIHSIIVISKEINNLLQKYEHIQKINEDIFNNYTELANVQNKLVHTLYL